MPPICNIDYKKTSIVFVFNTPFSWSAKKKNVFFFLLIFLNAVSNYLVIFSFSLEKTDFLLSGRPKTPPPLLVARPDLFSTLLRFFCGLLCYQSRNPDQICHELVLVMMYYNSFYGHGTKRVCVGSYRNYNKNFILITDFQFLIYIIDFKNFVLTFKIFLFFMSGLKLNWFESQTKDTDVILQWASFLSFVLFGFCCFQFLMPRSKCI